MRINVLPFVGLFFFPALTELAGGSSIALAFLAGSLRPKLYINLNGTLVHVERRLIHFGYSGR